MNTLLLVEIWWWGGGVFWTSSSVFDLLHCFVCNKRFIKFQRPNGASEKASFVVQLLLL